MARTDACPDTQFGLIHPHAYYRPIITLVTDPNRDEHHGVIVPATAIRLHPLMPWTLARFPQKDYTGTSLWRKYDAELMELCNFAKKIPEVGSLAKLPSGSNQLRHMKMPLVEALWRKKHPVW